MDDKKSYRVVRSRATRSIAAAMAAAAKPTPNALLWVHRAKRLRPQQARASFATLPTDMQVSILAVLAPLASQGGLSNV